MSGEREQEVWVAPLADFDLTTAERQLLLEWGRVAKEVSQSFQQGMNGGNGLWELMNEGFPVKSVRAATQSNRGDVQQELLRLEKESLKPTLFEIPKGYRVTTMDAMMPKSR